MYARFYGLTAKPFSLLPDPGFLFPSRKHRMALTLLEYGLMNQAGFAVVTGGIGTGKTTLLRYLLGRLDKGVTVGMITNTHSAFGELLQWMLVAFQLERRPEDKVGMYKALQDFLISEYAAGRRTVLVVDEAQNLSAEGLEELRMLSNINMGADMVLQTILVGQPGLRELLREPRLEQFAQRIGVDYHLDPLDPGETREYIRHRLQVAGGDPDLFDDAACAAIHEATEGTPRLINTLCDTALVYGYAQQLPRIDLALVAEVARDRAKGGIVPIKGPAAQGHAA